MDTLRFRRQAQPAQDEWFIPYHQPDKAGPSALRPITGYHSIGESPQPPRSTSGSNLFSLFSNPLSPDKLPFRFPRSGADKGKADAGIRRSPSYSSLQASSGSRMPSSSSVPTGLSAPKLLFSPLSREVRAARSSESSGEDGRTRGSGDTDFQPRSRTASTPNYAAHNHSRSSLRGSSQQWAVPTVCDRMVLVKPHITPHLITPPSSPPDDRQSDTLSLIGAKVLEDGKSRSKEREEWASYVKRRGRSLSFGATTPPADKPVIGNARTRAEERERRLSGRRKRSNSLSRLLRRSQDDAPRSSASTDYSGSRPNFLHMDSAASVGVVGSFGFLRRGSIPKSRSSGSGEPSPMFGDTDSDDPFRRSTPPLEKLFPSAKGHAHTRSSPDLMQLHRPAGRRQAPGPPLRATTLRIHQPTRQGVVVIGPGPTYKPPPVRRAPPTPMDMSKPLPDLPPEASPHKLDLDPFSSLTSEIGKAITTQDPTPVPLPSSRSEPLLSEDRGGSSHARAVMAKEHQNARIQRAFMVPASARRPTRVPVKGDPCVSPAKTSPGSPISPPGTRRKTALEEAIGRSRAASTSTLEQRHHDARTGLLIRPNTTGTDDEDAKPAMAVSRVPTIISERLSPELAYPITTRSSPTHFLAIPPMERGDSNVSKASKGTAYTDASEGWGRSALPSPLRDGDSLDTPSPGPSIEDRDFHGLFFRTPRERTGSFSHHAHPRPVHFPPLPSNPASPTGLGFGIPARSPTSRSLQQQQQQASRRRSSTTETSGTGTETMEIATPVVLPDGTDLAGERYSGFVVDRQLDDDSPRILDEYLAPGEGRHEMGSESSQGTIHRMLSSQASREFRVAMPPIRRPTIIATPPRHRNSRQSLVPDQVDMTDSPNASSTSIHDTTQPRYTPTIPALSPGTFGVSGLVIDRSDPLDFSEITADGSPTLEPPRPPFASSDFTTRRSSDATTNRYSAVPSFVDDFPNPPPSETQQA